MATYIFFLCILYIFLISAIMDCLVMPLQERIEDWKRSLINLDKEHAKGTISYKIQNKIR